VSWYLTIRSDTRYSQYISSAPLIDFLASMPELRQSGPLVFQASDGKPWVSVMLAACRPDGSYNSNGLFLPQVNVVELVCSDSADREWYEILADRIAVFLGWSVLDEYE
jgi:hypothetical protein